MVLHIAWYVPEMYKVCVTKQNDMVNYLNLRTKLQAPACHTRAFTKWQTRRYARCYAGCTLLSVGPSTPQRRLELA